jgi:hypothetical protein
LSSAYLVETILVSGCASCSSSGCGSGSGGLHCSTVDLLLKSGLRKKDPV